MVQSTNTALPHTGIQSTVIMFGNQREYLSWAVYPRVKLAFLVT